MSRTLLCTTVLLLAACEGRLGHRHDDTVEDRVPVPAGVDRVRLDVDRGAVTLRAGVPGVVVVRSVVRRVADTADGLAALMTLDIHPRVDSPEPNVLSLTAARCPDELEARSHQVITKTVLEVPPGMQVEARTGFGHVAAEAQSGVVRLETGHGDVRLDGCTGGASVLTAGGDAIIVQAHRGDLRIVAGKCQTMQVFVDELGPAGVDLRVEEKGGVQLHLPGDAAFDLEAVTEVGRARNGFGVPIEPLPPRQIDPAAPPVEFPRGLMMRGQVAGGGPPVVIELKAGNLSVGARPE